MKFSIKSAILVFVIFVTFSMSLKSQESTFFQVEFETFSPPVKDVILSFQGKEPMPFMANDINGTEHYLKNYKGQVVFLYFWNGECKSCLEHMTSLNLLHKEASDRLQIISFADESKAEATFLAETHGIEFPVLTNGRMLGEAAYGIELGYPRLFAINQDGVVVHVLPQELLEGKSDIYLELKDLLNKVIVSSK